MKRVLSLSLLAALTLTGCTASKSPARSEDVTADGKDDTVAASAVAPKLAPMLAFLRDDKNLVTQLGPEGTTAEFIKKRVKVVSYKDFGQAVDTAVRSISKNYQVDIGNSKYRRAYGLLDLLSVGDMYLGVKAGYGEDSFVDKLVVESKREQVRELARTLLPEAALINADHASTVSTGNYILVLGDIESGQAIVMTVEYEMN